MVGDGGAQSRRSARTGARRSKVIRTAAPATATATAGPASADAVSAASTTTDAARALLSRHHGVLKAMALHCRGADPRDLVNEVSVRALANPAGFVGADRPVAWLNTVMRNVWRDSLRKQKRRGTDGELYDERWPSRSPSPETLTLGREVERALATLKPRHRQVLVLKEVEGMTYREIAEQLGVPASAVPSLLHRARTRLRAVLAEATP